MAREKIRGDSNEAGEVSNRDYFDRSGSCRFCSPPRLLSRPLKVRDSSETRGKRAHKRRPAPPVDRDATVERKDLAWIGESTSPNRRLSFRGSGGAPCFEWSIMCVKGTRRLLATCRASRLAAPPKSRVPAARVALRRQETRQLAGASLFARARSLIIPPDSSTWNRGVLGCQRDPEFWSSVTMVIASRCFRSTCVTRATS